MAAEPLNQAAAARHQRAVERAEQALRDLDADGRAVSFQVVAARAGVSRQWLYTQPALRRQIEQLRDRTSARSVGVPARQRATEASLRQRLETLRVENQRAARGERQPQDRARDRLRPAAFRAASLTGPRTGPRRRLPLSREAVA
jgi:uncharacterized protein DUF6262